MATLDDEQAAINRRQRIAEMLMQQGQQPLETNQVAGGYVVPVSPMAGVAKVAQQLAGAYLGKKADERQTALADKKLADVASIDLSAPDLSSQLMKRGMVTEALAAQKDAGKVHREGIPAGFNATDGGGIAPMPMANGSDYGQFLLQQAGAKAQIPSYGEPQKLAIAQDSNAMAHETQARAEKAQQMDMTRLQMQQDAQARAEATAADNKLQNIPATHRMAYAENDNALRKIDEAIEKIKANPKAMGYQNSFGDNISQRLDPNGVPVRAAIAEIGGVKLHDLSGAAVAASEAPRLMPLIPLTTDTPDAAIAKLQSLKNEYSGINTQIEGMYSGNEYRNPIKVKQHINVDIKGKLSPEDQKLLDADIAKEQAKQAPKDIGADDPAYQEYLRSHNK